MPTTRHPARSESTALAIPPPPRRAVVFRRALGRYFRARWGDLWGSPLIRMRRQLMDYVEAMTMARPRPGASTLSPSWDATVARQWWSDARLRQEYEANAVPARAFLVGAILSMLIAVYHLIYLQLSGVLTSLGMVFVLVGVALGPA